MRSNAPEVRRKYRIGGCANADPTWSPSKSHQLPCADVVASLGVLAPLRIDQSFASGSEVLARTDTTDSLAEELYNDPDKSDGMYTKIRARGTVHSVFRKALLSAYDCPCSICELSFEEALDAAHVIPSAKSSPALRISPRNGILLCANHHKLLIAVGLESPKTTGSFFWTKVITRMNTAKQIRRRRVWVWCGKRKLLK